METVVIIVLVKMKEMREKLEKHKKHHQINESAAYLLNQYNNTSKLL